MKLKNILAAGALAAAPAHAVMADDLIIHNATLVQTTPDLARTPNSYVVIKGNRIADIGSGTIPAEYTGLERVDASGQFLIPGLIDSHVHLGSLPGIPYNNPEKFAPLINAYYDQAPRSYLYYGYTTVIDLNASDEAIAMMRAKDVRPNIYECGGGMPVMDGYPMVFRPKETRYKTVPNFIFNENQRDSIPNEIRAEEHTPKAVVARIKAKGAVCAKTFYEKGFRPDLNWPTPSADLMAELKREAEKAELPLLVHANRESAQKFAHAHGADILVHGMWHWNPVGGNRSFEPGESAFKLIEEIAAADIGYMPTLQVLAGEAALFDPAFNQADAVKAVVPPNLVAWYQTEEANWYRNILLQGRAASADQLTTLWDGNMERMRQSARLTKHLHDHGGRLLFGSDTPSDETWGNPVGLNGYREMQRWRAAGIPLDAILRAATWDNAHAFNINANHGSIAKGKIADLLILNADPSTSLEAYDQIGLIISRGKRLDRASLQANR